MGYCVNIAMGSLAAWITHDIAGKYGWSTTIAILLEVIVVSIVLLIFGEILPKTLAIRFSMKFANIVYLPLKFFMALFYPLTIVLNGINKLVLKLIPIEEKPFDTEEEALSIANGVRYGLAASIWTSNLNRAHRMAAEIETGMVWINTWLMRDLRVPFGGMKDSGVGREGGKYSLEFFSESRNICIHLEDS